MSFKSKLFLSYILIVLIPVSISGAWIYNTVIVPIHGERLLLIEQSMDQLQQAANKDIDDIEKIGYLVSTNIVLKKALLKRYYDQSEIIEAMYTTIHPLLSWFTATHQDAGDFHFFTVNDTLPESGYFMPSRLFAKEEWYQEMVERVRTSYPYWEPSHSPRSYPYTRNTSQAVYSMFYPINEDFPNEASYLEFEVSTDHFMAKSEAVTLLQSGFVIGIGWEGDALPAAAIAAESVDGMRSSGLLEGIDWSAAGIGSMVHEGTAYQYFVRPLDRLEASLVGFVPQTEIDGAWIKTRQAFMLLIILLAVLLAGLSFLLSGLLIKRIVGMVNGVRKIQNGNFHVRIPVKGEDEVDVLASSINSMAGQIDGLINRVYKSQVAQKEAELSALQAQINPHFLFNTLETLRMMAETEDQQRLADAIAALGSIMRYNLYNTKEPVTLDTELEHIEDYLQIQNLLHNNRIRLECEVPWELQMYRIPNLLLQPLVENCVIHGIKGHVGQLVIRIVVEQPSAELASEQPRDGTDKADKADNQPPSPQSPQSPHPPVQQPPQLPQSPQSPQSSPSPVQQSPQPPVPPQIVCRIVDNGAGMQKERLTQLQAWLEERPGRRGQLSSSREELSSSQEERANGAAASLGLANVYDRIRYFYGDQAQMAVESAAREGTAITLLLPASGPIQEGKGGE